ncbi:MAG: glycosyltransferase family 2 protein [Sphingomonas phyllosphaerae]|uniref:glycosyltransferase family 2 protein n=1 Tax=Sphingomonas phyllosphaerae TaxID=257003 RepID=UPI002FF92723
MIEGDASAQALAPTLTPVWTHKPAIQSPYIRFTLFDRSARSTENANKYMLIPHPAPSAHPVLSICIPTYQRSSKLAVLLNSIICQDDPRLEVVISDNGSSDDTAEMVHGFSFLRPLKWHQWEKNVGFDCNLMKVVSLAGGDYCWLVGSDDALTPGAVAHILDLIDTYRPSGILPSATICDADLYPVPENPPVNPIPFEKISPNEIISSIGVYLGFFSLQIVRRDLWIQAASDERWQATAKNWSQYYMMLKIAANLAVNGWLRDPTRVILYRSSSFTDQIDEIGSIHTKIINDLTASMEAITATVPPYILKKFMNDRVQFEIRRDMFFWNNASQSWRNRMDMLLSGGRILGKYYWWWTKMVPIIIMPRGGVMALRSAVAKAKEVIRIVNSRSNRI